MRASKNPRVHSGAVAYGDYLLQLQLEPSVLAEQLQDEPQLQELFSAIWFSLFRLSVLCDLKDLEHFIDGGLLLRGLTRSHHVRHVREQVILNQQLV